MSRRGERVEVGFAAAGGAALVIGPWSLVICGAFRREHELHEQDTNDTKLHKQSPVADRRDACRTRTVQIVSFVQFVLCISETARRREVITWPAGWWRSSR